MRHNLYPDQEMDATYSIDFKAYYQKGYRGIIFDVDNTLVPHGAKADQRAINLFDNLHKMGFKTILLSNNKEPRVKMFSTEVGTKYIFKAGKPGKKNYIKAVEHMGTKRENTLFIGDQIFTDIWGARRVGIYSILVHPINPKEEIQIVLKRYLEAVVLWYYHRYLNQKK